MRLCKECRGVILKKIVAFILIFIFCIMVLAACGGRKNTVTTERLILSSLIEELEASSASDIYSEALLRAKNLLDDENSSSAQITDMTAELVALREEYLNRAVPFSDKALEYAVKNVLKKSDISAVTVSEAMEVKELDLSYDSSNTQGLLPITGTVDFKYFPNLKKLILSGNEITDVSGLATLTELTELDISSNKIPDITPLAGLSELKLLNISGNLVSDISMIGGIVPSLTFLDISRNSISDFETLENAVSLEELYIDGYDFSTLDFLYGIKTLDRLYMRNASFSESVELKNLIYISFLDISGSSGFSLDDISYLTNLRSLSAASCGIDDSTFVGSMVNLTELDLSGNSLEAFEFYDNVPALTKVDISENNLQDLTVSPCSALVYLDASGNSLDSVSFPGETPSLQTLDLSRNELTSVDVDSLEALISLNLAVNMFSGDLRIVSDTVETLDVSENSLSGIELSIPTLKSLDVSANPEIELNDISLCVSLTSLDMTGIPVYEGYSFLQPLVNLKVLKTECLDSADKTLPTSLTLLEELYISGANDSTVSSISSFSSLKRLELSDATLTSPQIRGFRYLTYLSLSGAVSDISGINSLEGLEELYISGADIESPLISDFPSLKCLSLISCGIRDFSGISGLPSLTYLNVSRNSPSSLVFSDLPKLKYIDLSECSIEYINDFYLSVTDCVIILRKNLLTELSGLVPLRKIRILDISQNNITDYSALESITVAKVIR